MLWGRRKGLHAMACVEVRGLFWSQCGFLGSNSGFQACAASNLYPLNHLSGPSFLFKKKKVSAHSENFTDIESYTLECLRLYGRALPLHTPSGNLWKFLPVSIQHFFLMSMQTNNSKHSFFLFQENSQMFQGRPCKDMSILNEYFPHGITNGASWYNVPGKDHSLTTWIFLFSRVLQLVNDLFQFWERTIFFLKKRLKWFKTLQ